MKSGSSTFVDDVQAVCYYDDQERLLTWFVSVSQFESVEKVEKLADGDLESVEKTHVDKDPVTRLAEKRRKKMNPSPSPKHTKGS